MKEEKRKQLSKSAASGTVALIFMILGFQLAVFFMKIVEKPVTVEEPPISQESKSPVCSNEQQIVEKRSASAKTEKAVKSKLGGYSNPARPQREPRSYQSFRFNPNAISVDSLVLLGLTRKQAESIDNYRAKGGKFGKPSDFAKMYVVTDTLYKRLEPFIDIPLLNLNSADSTALVSLKGIGPYYAREILKYRSRLGGYVSVGQLLEIHGMDKERLDGIRESIRIDTSLVEMFDLWTASSEKLASHPYLGEKKTRQLMRYKEVCAPSEWNLEGLFLNHILDSASYLKIRPYLQKQSTRSEF